MHVIEREITINASPEKVWDELVDFESYPQWNPFILWAKGAPAVGRTIQVRIQPPGDRATTHQPTILASKPGELLQWKGSVAVPGLFGALHEFMLRPTDYGTRLVHREEFTGLLVPFLRRTLRRTAQGFEELNEALKQCVENK